MSCMPYFESGVLVLQYFSFFIMIDVGLEDKQAGARTLHIPRLGVQYYRYFTFMPSSCNVSVQFRYFKDDKVGEGLLYVVLTQL
jgi:hypothetical protein